ncbi:MAG: DNA polymerase III subunit gamma/tau [Vicinamibacterales bacterium]
MSYQVLARKWRPQRFEDVLGQHAVTRTLKNALKTRRIAQAFVFSGPRGCGKTTTARILARALNCVNGPTPEPCGVCDACVEIAEGRDIDVLEIDAATHTGVDNVREVIIEGLAIAPVRDRYRVFIIDEVHMLSASSFNALLKSIEEPPPHVIFMMATTEQQKIPDTVLSRSQVYEFKTISAKTVAERLRAIAQEERIEIPDEGLMLLARAGEGSMRDSLSAFDQVRAFAGDTIAVDDVVTVLGLVGRDLVFDMLEATAAEDAPAAFALVERAIERGYDLRLLCRELGRATRDLLVLSVDPKRAADPDVAGEGERERLVALTLQWSREDLLRAFDLLMKAEQEVKTSDQPRYNVEMALLRLMHLRKLVPLADLLGLADSKVSAAPKLATNTRASEGRRERQVGNGGSSASPQTIAFSEPPATGQAATSVVPLKDQILNEIKAAKHTFYNVVVAAAYRIDVNPGSLSLVFQPNQRMARQQCEEQKAWLQGLAEKVMGRPVVVSIGVNDGSAASTPTPLPAPPARPSPEEITRDAMANATVQAVLEIFPVEKTTVEEI